MESTHTHTQPIKLKLSFWSVFSNYHEFTIEHIVELCAGNNRNAKHFTKAITRIELYVGSFGWLGFSRSLFSSQIQCEIQ